MKITKPPIATMRTAEIINPIRTRIIPTKRRRVKYTKP